MAIAEGMLQGDSLRTERATRRLVRRGGRFVVGPWLSEVGFELLYWLPFLRWVIASYGLEPEQLVAVTRGGAGEWYRGLCDSTVDVFSLYEPDELKAWHTRRVEDTRSQKQTSVAEFDRQVLERVRERLDDDVAVLHPQAMYKLFRPFWAHRRPISFVDRRTVFARLPEPRVGDAAREALSRLPREYVAVKAYFSSCFPETSANRDWLRRALERLAAKTAVVLLATGLDLDDHLEYDERSNQGVLTLTDHMSPADNLAVQTRAITGARALFATYGGFSYLGPFLNVTSYSFYSTPNFNPSHHNVMALAMRQLQAAGLTGGFVALDTRDAALLETVYGGV
jgi:hypothetical protein